MNPSSDPIPYSRFLDRKERKAESAGMDVDVEDVNESLFDWQRRIVVWACRTGRSAIWADTGLGKTRMQIEWCRLMAGDGIGLIVAPLAVCSQTIREAESIDVPVGYARDASEIAGPGLWVTNYERVPGFRDLDIRAVVLDESSILKQHTGRMRNILVDGFRDVRYRLACSATPAPNDPDELCSQAEFLGRSTVAEMRAMYFINKTGEDKTVGSGWRLKGHAVKPLMRWMSQWAVAVRKPSDIGGDDTGYVLPGLETHIHTVPYTGPVQEGHLIADLGGVGRRSRVRRATLDQRVNETVRLVESEPGEQWVIWVGLNDEGDLLERLIPDAVNVKGSMSAEDKAKSFLDFADGRIRVLITKGSMASFGLNWQNCARIVFCGLNDSWESYYQSIRRCYRYGQNRVVQVHAVVSDLEREIAENVMRKERQANELTGLLVETMNENNTYGKAA